MFSINYQVYLNDNFPPLFIFLWELCVDTGIVIDASQKAIIL